ncbi:MAG: hypothetical protein LBT20_01205 [Clostridiales bacterium]|jgi:hypothetical protein|nr:hypothetical protein [Clostridiales bacterium]
MGVGDWIALVTLIVAVLGGGIGAFAILQWQSGNKIKRAEFIGHIIENLRFDYENAQTMYLFEYDAPWYNESFHGGSDTERKVDKLFSYLSYICYLREKNILSEDEFSILEYKIRSICLSIQAQAYLWTLYHLAQKNNILCPFHNLVAYMRTNVFDEKQRERFDSPDTKVSGYSGVLNFPRKAVYESRR